MGWRLLASCAILGVFAIALLWPLMCGRSLYWGDLIVYFVPMGDYAGSALKQGRIPLWNPYVLGGQPFLGNPQMGVFYPSTALLWFLPSWKALGISLGVHLWLCGVLMCAYLRRWTRYESSAIAGGMVYMGSACLLGRLQFPPMVLSAAYLPLLLMLIDRQLETPSLWKGLGAGVAFGLMVLAAHTQMAYFETLLCAIYLAARLWREHKRRDFANGAARRRWIVVKAAPFLLSALLGAWLCAVLVLPAAQLLKESPREEMTAVQANRFFLEARQLLTLVWPHFVGHPARGNYHAAGNAWEPAIFIGWVPLVFIGLAACQWRQWRVRFWLIVGGIGLWLAFGIKGGLYQAAFALVPGVGKFHDPARFLYFTTLGFAALTAFGMDSWRKKQGDWRLVAVGWFRIPQRVSGVVILLLIAVPMVWFGQDWNPTTNADAWKHRPAMLNALARLDAMPTQTQGRVYLPEYRAEWGRFISYYDFGLDDARTLAAFQDKMMPNMPMRWGVESLAGYEPVPLYAPFAVEGLTAAALERGEPNATRLMAMQNANTLLMPTGMKAETPRLDMMNEGKSVGGLKAWRNRDALPRVWLVRRTRRVEGRIRIAAALTAPEFMPEREAVVSFGLNDRLAREADGLEWQLPGEAAEVCKPVRIVAQSAERLEVEVDAGERSAFLVASLMAYPGWQATVDGEPDTLVRTDGAILGVNVPPGVHRVVVKYEPGAYRIGLYLSLLACGVVSAGVGVGMMRGGRNVMAR